MHDIETENPPNCGPLMIKKSWWQNRY
jgi:hypothetical protein